MGSIQTIVPRTSDAVEGVPDGVVLYDGICVLCSGMFRFVATRDQAARFRFTPVQGGYGRWLAGRLGIDPEHPDTIAVVVCGRALLHSDAAIAMLRELPGWRWVGALLLAPRPLRDWAYDLVARHRYRLFGRTEACLVPGPELRRHVLPDSTPHG